MADSDAPPTQAEIAEIRARAAKVLEEMSPEEIQGWKDLQNTMLASSLPAVRRLFRQMLSASSLTGSAKARAMREISEFSQLTEVVCVKVDFYDSVEKRARQAYLLLDECPKEHDLGAQLAKLQSRVPPDKWPGVLQHLSMLVGTLRSVYSQIAGKRQKLLQELGGELWKDYTELKIDVKNTTLYLNQAWPNRVGIVVQLDDELPSEEATGPHDDPSEEPKGPHDDPSEETKC